MQKQSIFSVILAGSIAGVINGLFGAGGGMVLVPLLRKLHCVPDAQLFPTSVSIILPLSIVSLSIHWSIGSTSLQEAFPYLLGGCIGGIVAGFTDGKIPVKWLHRFLGAMILWGGVRYLW